MYPGTLSLDPFSRFSVSSAGKPQSLCVCVSVVWASAGDDDSDDIDLPVNPNLTRNPLTLAPGPRSSFDKPLLLST